MSDGLTAPRPAPLDERLVDLVLQRESVGLSADEAAEFARLSESADRHELDALERSVAALKQGLVAADIDDSKLVEEPLPAELRSRLIAVAPTPRVQSDQAKTRAASSQKELDARVAGLRRFAFAGWLAAAAAIALAASIWNAARQPGTGPTPPSDRQLVDAAGDVVRRTFKPQVAEISGATGEVVWSDALQKGYLKVAGLAPNDPAVKQYQLWIVDPKRDEKPVDAGVFDVSKSDTTDGSVILSFTAKLPVRDPAAFAITSEKPGGVVTTAGPILMLAAE